MADILPFRPRPRPAINQLVTFDQLDVRVEIEEAARLTLDTAERLIAILDRWGGDRDLEPAGGDEPELDAPEEHGNNLVWFRGSSRDVEVD